MLSPLVNLLPLFVVKWLARRKCPRLYIGKYEYVEALDDVLILIDEDLGDESWD